jgi:hypothetical protein
MSTHVVTPSEAETTLAIIEGTELTEADKVKARHFVESFQFTTTAVFALSHAIRELGEGAQEFEIMANMLLGITEKVAKVESTVV